MLKKKKKKKLQIVGSFNGISTTCKLEIDFFSLLRSISVCRVYVTQSSLERPFQVTHDVSSEREFRCSFIVRMKSNKDTRYKQTNYRPDYILDRIVGVDFENFAVS